MGGKKAKAIGSNVPWKHQLVRSVRWQLRFSYFANKSVPDFGLYTQGPGARVEAPRYVHIGAGVLSIEPVFLINREFLLVGDGWGAPSSSSEDGGGGWR